MSAEVLKTAGVRVYFIHLLLLDNRNDGLFVREGFVEVRHVEHVAA
jgi:hypothetical protein